MSPLIISSFIFLSNGAVIMIKYHNYNDKKIKIFGLLSLFIGAILLAIGCGLSV